MNQLAPLVASRAPALVAAAGARASPAHCFRTRTDQERQQESRIKLFAKPSVNYRCLREGDGWSRREAAIGDRDVGRGGWGIPTARMVLANREPNTSIVEIDGAEKMRRRH
jgi:hypothetical protein